MNHQFAGEERWRWVRVGAWQGAGRGLILACVYMCVPLLLALLSALFWVSADLNAAPIGGEWELMRDPAPFFWGALGALTFAAVYLAFGLAIGAAPAFVIGGISGALLGAALSLPHIAPYRSNRLAVGAGIAIVVAAAVNQAGVLLFWDGALDQLGPHLFFLGVPSLVYVATCLWLSDRFPALVAADARVREFPVRPRQALADNTSRGLE